MTRSDDLFLEVLDEDEELAWRLASAAAHPAPAGLRERIVARHRRRAWWSSGTARRLAFVPAALAFIAGAVVLAFPTEVAVVAAVARNARVVAMSPTTASGGRGAVVVQDDAAYLVLDLPQPPAGKAYEAWVIRDGKPLRAGMAPVRSGIVALRLDRALRPGDIAAVTVERAAGEDAPTSDPVILTRIPPG